ncbi:MAG TPA: MarR family transcriptional regulator [Terriglobales bacterium]|nr:MarR family transcriptional regulator [Terriglobales bacterium]
MSIRSRAAARKFWDVVPRVMSTVAAEARRGAHRLEPSHFRMLKMLSMKSFNMSELAEQQGVSLPSMSASVQTLVERGWLERRESASDRRAAELFVTERGKIVLEHEYLRMLGWTAKRLNKLTDEQLAQVELGLDTLRTVFDMEPQLRATFEELPKRTREKLQRKLSKVHKRTIKKIDKKITRLNSRLSY